MKMLIDNDVSVDVKIVSLLLTTSRTIFHPSKFSLVLVLVDYHLYSMDLQNKIL